MAAKRKNKKWATRATKTSVAKIAQPAEMAEVISKTSKRSYKKIATIVLGLLVIAGLLYIGKGLLVAAIVDGKPISRLALIQALEKQGGKQTLDDLVTKQIIFDQAAKAGVTVSADDVNKQISNLEDSMKTQGTTLDAALAMQGQTRADLEENVRIQKLVEGLLKDKVAVSDDEIKTYFDQNKTSFAKDATLDSVKDQIKQQLQQSKLQTEFQTWITTERAQSNVKYFVNF